LISSSVFAAAILLLASCSTVPPLAPWGGLPAPDFRQAGPISLSGIAVSAVTDVEVNGCVANVELHAPARSDAKAVLIFAHGLFHGIEQHRELAQHLATWGVPTYLVGLCGGGWINGGAPVFAKLMRAVAERSNSQKIIYGGFSAGGSAAYIAALDDPKTVGLLGLDPVGKSQPTDVKRATFPSYGLFGPANKCNAQQVGRSLMGAGTEDVVRELAHATHCHFESPTDFLCRIPCGEPGDRTYLSEQHSRIYALATAFVRWRAGLDNKAPIHWWQAFPGVLSDPTAGSPSPDVPAPAGH
jgi:pimeloyl-ACP methyl ester carboxylesterase